VLLFAPLYEDSQRPDQSPSPPRCPCPSHRWVHLNSGDAGLRRLFRKLRDTLSPGGLLVLEPQPWRSYKSAVRKKQTCAVPFR
jgi:hypothetical protein